VDILWSPWRYDYLKNSGTGGRTDPNFCIFCDLPTAAGTDAEKNILLRSTYNYVVLNRYPYISGHLLIVPFVHLGDLDLAVKESTDELMDLTKLAQSVLRETYQPHGFNLGMNLGAAAGAGVAGHYHLHAMPRWSGDVNFMTAVGETRVVSEDLSTTYEKLLPGFAKNRAILNGTNWA
jgi:ATP adenylyltransferase